MKSILLIGLGRFGKHIAMHLNHLGHQVMAVDTVFAIMMYVLLPSATIFRVRWKQLLCLVN